MNLSEKSFKLFLLVFVLAVGVVMISSLVLRQYNERNYPEKFGRARNVGQEEETLPQIINAPNENVVIGEEFIFIPRIAPLDSNFSFNLLESPDWMVLQEGIIRGRPQESGVFQYILRLGYGASYYDETFYLVVEVDSDE